MSPKFYECLCLRLRHKSDDNLVRDLVQVASALRAAILKNPLEKLDLEKCYDVLTNMISELVQLERLDKAKLRKIFDNSAHVETYKLKLLNEAQVLSFFRNISSSSNYLGVSKRALAGVLGKRDHFNLLYRLDWVFWD